MNLKKERRYKRDELRELLIHCGVEEMEEHGIRMGLDNLTLSNVFQRLKDETGRSVTCASVYDRIWPNQEAFRLSVLYRMLENAGKAFDEDLSATIERILKSADLSTQNGRQTCLQEIFRIGARQHLIYWAKREDYKIILGAIASFISRKNEKSEQSLNLHHSLKNYFIEEMNNLRQMYEMIFSKVKYRPKKIYTTQDFTLAVASVVEGTILRQAILDEYTYDNKGPDSNWTLTGLAIRGLVDVMLEPIPENDPEFAEPDETAADSR